MTSPISVANTCCLLQVATNFENTERLSNYLKGHKWDWMREINQDWVEESSVDPHF